MDLPVQCCFCGNTLESRNRDPLSLILPFEDEGMQQFWTHEKCLREHLHESVPLYFDDEDEFPS
jgi:hypothetical protein